MPTELGLKDILSLQRVLSRLKLWSTIGCFSCFFESRSVHRSLEHNTCSLYVNIVHRNCTTCLMLLLFPLLQSLNLLFWNLATNFWYCQIICCPNVKPKASYLLALRQWGIPRIYSLAYGFFALVVFLEWEGNCKNRPGAEESRLKEICKQKNVEIFLTKTCRFTGNENRR